MRENSIYGPRAGAMLKQWELVLRGLIQTAPMPANNPCVLACAWGLMSESTETNIEGIKEDIHIKKSHKMDLYLNCACSFTPMLILLDNTYLGQQLN